MAATLAGVSLRSCLATALLLFGCASDDLSESPTRTTPAHQTTVTHATEVDNFDARDDYATELAREFGCKVVGLVDFMVYPIRGGSARAGVTCVIDGVTVDVFERNDVDDDRGGSIENIRQTVSANITPGCGWLAIGDLWFLVANDRATLERAVDKLGGSVTELTPASAVISYGMPGGCSSAP